MVQRLVGSACAFLVLTLASVAPAAEHGALGALSRQVLASFQRERTLPLTDALEHRLAPPPPGDWRVRVLASLPRRGELTPTATGRRKLAAAERFLDYTARRPFDFKVADLGQAFVGLYFRTVVIVSVEALALVDDDELCALAAHELGHDGHAADYSAAISKGDTRRMRELELEADGFAVLALVRAGLSPECLVAAIEKMMRYNDLRQAPNSHDAREVGTTSDRYVPLQERIAFIRAVAALHRG